MRLESTLFILILCISTIFKLSCTRKPFEIQPRLIHSVDQFTDSTFFTDITNIEGVVGGFLVSDKVRSQIFELDENLALVKSFGAPGEGPGEINGLLRFFKDGDELYVANEGKQTVEVFKYSSGSHFTTWHIPDQLKAAPLEYRFFVEKDHAYIAASDAGIPIAAFNPSGTFKALGRKIDFGNPTQTLIRNNRFLLKLNDNHFLAIPDSYALLEVYDSSGQFVAEQPIADQKPVLDRQFFIDQQGPESDNVYYRLFRDIYFDSGNNTLYLLCISGKESPICNQILAYKFQGQSFDYLGTILLPGRWYSSVFVDGSRILAYETRDDLLQLFEF